MSNDKKKLTLIILAVLMAGVLIALVLFAVTDLVDKQEDENPAPTVSAVQAQPGRADTVVDTPYGKMNFPGKWAAYLKIDRTETPELEICFTASFPSGKKQPLFDIRFAEARDPAVGQVVTEDGVAVGVHVTVHPFSPDGSWSVSEIDATNEMLESLNTLLDGLNMVPLGTPIPEISGDEMVLDTPYCKLYLPKRWKEEIRMIADDSKGYYQVVFSAVIGEHDPVEVFVISFGGDTGEGQKVGVVMTENDVPVVIRLRTASPDTDGWSTVDRDTLSALREDVNYLLGKLPQ